MRVHGLELDTFLCLCKQKCFPHEVLESADTPSKRSPSLQNIEHYPLAALALVQDPWQPAKGEAFQHFQVHLLVWQEVVQVGPLEQILEGDYCSRSYLEHQMADLSQWDLGIFGALLGCFGT